MFKRRQRFQTDHWEQPEDYSRRQAPESNSIGVRGQQNEVQAARATLKPQLNNQKAKQTNTSKAKTKKTTTESRRNTVLLL